MATTLKQTEAVPDPAELAALIPDFDAVAWERIEAYTARRWGPRGVEWIAEGPGEWLPPLQPATIDTVESWSAADLWEAADLAPSALGGFWLPYTGPFRFRGTVGEAVKPPEAVLEAMNRLSVYLWSQPGRAGATSEVINLGPIQFDYRRPAAWLADAMRLSGAGDLLRAYRWRGA